MIIGEPTLDALGFVSDRHSIELRTEDVRFPTILPELCPSGADQFLHLAEHRGLDGRADQAKVHEVELIMRKQHSKGRFWLEPGPDAPLGVEVVEGPLVQTSSSRCKVNLIVDEKVRIGPATRLVQARELTTDDEALLKAVRETDRRASRAHAEVTALARQAADSAARRRR